MTSVGEITPIQGITGNNPVSNGEVTKETFLKLLSTQLQYQDPLEPASDVEFIQQMATFSMLEQQQITNSNLQIMGLYENSINNSNALNIVGKHVKVADSVVDHAQGQSHTLTYEGDSAAGRVYIRVLDERGREVYETTEVGSEDGEQKFHWYGVNNAGEPVDSGKYTVEVTLENAEGETYKPNVFQQQKVNGISYEGGTIMVVVGDKRLPIENVVEVFDSAASGAEAAGEEDGGGAGGGFLTANTNPKQGKGGSQGNQHYPNFGKNHPYHPFRVLAGGR